MQQASISIRVDKDIKKRFYELCDAFGLSAATAINIFMKAVVREHKIPFEIGIDRPEDSSERYRKAFNSMRESVAASGMPEMSLEEINALIKEVRDERKGK